MAITLSIDQKGLEAAGKWSAAVAKQLPFATSQALNNVAFDGRTAVNKATISFFNRPTKFTQSAFLVQKSTKRNLAAAIYANDQPGRNRARYLRYGLQGGTRQQKGFERFFTGVSNDGSIPPGATFVPTSNVKTTAFGNVSLATIKSITRGINGNPRGGFFIGTPRNSSRPPGIYRRSRERLFAYFIAQPRPSYTSRFPMPDIAGKVISRRFNGYFITSLERALATARM
jgi:hypothetical protein